MTPECSSEVVWSEDFEDGDMEGWTITQGNFTVVNGYLESSVKEKYKGPIGGADIDLLSCCFTQSNIAVGTWSFDIYFDCQGEHPQIFIEFMTMKQTRWSLNSDASFLQETYGIYAGYEYPGIYKLYTHPYFPGFKEIDPYSTIPGTKRKVWHHIDITRDQEGLIRVYIDGILGIDKIDTIVTESSYFGIILEYSFRGKSYIDNIVVSDTIDIHPSETEIGKINTRDRYRLPLIIILFTLIILPVILWISKNKK